MRGHGATMSILADPAPKLSVRAVTSFAYANVFRRLGLVLELGWIPIIALLGGMILPSLLSPKTVGVDDAFSVGPADMVQALVAFLSLSAFAVRWHQALLLGDPRRLPPATFFRGWLRFMLYLLLVYMLVAVILALSVLGFSRIGTSGIGEVSLEIGAIALSLAAVGAILRCCLLFPAAAIGAPLGFREAWTRMRGNGWRLGIASILNGVPVMVVFGVIASALLIAALPDDPDMATAPPMGLVIMSGVIETIADILLVALGASLLSAYYRGLVEGKPLTASA